MQLSLLVRRYLTAAMQELSKPRISLCSVVFEQPAEKSRYREKRLTCVERIL